MPIDQNDFRDSLAELFIQLLDSRRGVATELAVSIGKPASFVSQVKRGRPVNSLHLKAVGLVFGPQKVLELLALENIETKKIVYRQEDDPSNLIIVKHQDLVKRFKNPKRGLHINERLIYIEDTSEELFDKADTYLQGLYDAATTIKKTATGNYSAPDSDSSRQEERREEQRPEPVRGQNNKQAGTNDK